MIKEGVVKQQKSTFDDLENSQPVQVICSANRARLQLDIHLLKGSGVWFLDPTNLLSRSQEQLCSYSGKVCEGLLSGGWGHHELQGRLTRFLRILYPLKHCQPILKGTDMKQNEGNLLTKQSDKCIGLHCLVCKWIELPPQQAQRRKHQTVQDYSQV